MLNRVTLIGFLGKNPELRHTQSGVAVCTFSLATSESYKDKQGQKQETTEWHRVVVWQQQAELCAKYLSKGRGCIVEGKIQTRSYDDKDGTKRYATEIVAQKVTFLPDGKGKGSGAAAEGHGLPTEDPDLIPF